MSAYVEGNAAFKSVEALVAALTKVATRKGAPWTEDQIEQHQEAVQLTQWQGQDVIQHAHVIIRRRHVGGMANDIGFEFKPGGECSVWISDYDKGFYNEQWLGLLKQQYVEEAIGIEAKKQGFRVTKTTKGGKVHLTLKR